MERPYLVRNCMVFFLTESGLDPSMFLVQILKFQLLFKRIILDWKEDRRVTEEQKATRWAYIWRAATMAVRQPCIVSVMALAGSMSGSGRQLPVWLAKDLLKNVGEERSPLFSERFGKRVGNGNQGVFQKHVSGWHQMRMPWQAPRSPPLAPLRTHGTLTAASGCVDSQQLRFVYASWDAWHCHFINYLWLLLGVERAMNYLVLQLQTWFLSKRYSCVNTC